MFRPGPVLALLAAALLGGCAPARPFVATAGAPLVRRLDAGGLDLVFAVEVRSPGPAARVESVRFEARIDGRAIALGEAAVDVAVPPGGTARLELPLAVEAGADLPAGVRPALARGGRVAVELVGTLALVAAGGREEVAFRAAGRARSARGGPAADEAL